MQFLIKDLNLIPVPPAILSIKPNAHRGLDFKLTKLPAITQYANCSTPTAIRKTRKASSSFTRCGVSSTYLFHTPAPICCKSCALRTWPLALLAGLLAARVGWPAEEETTVVGLVELGGMAEGEGVVEIFLGAILGGVVVSNGLVLGLGWLVRVDVRSFVKLQLASRETLSPRVAQCRMSHDSREGRGMSSMAAYTAEARRPSAFTIHQAKHLTCAYQPN